jgi:type II secretory ATPase GspE/PulE/Tfp pilus assembly ATPase PilB-like protein
MAEPETVGVVQLVESLIHRATNARATDIHFDPGDGEVRVRIRVDGLLADLERLPAAIAPNIVARLKVLAGLLTYRSDIPQEGSIRADAALACEIRVATLPTTAGERVVLRLLANANRFLRLDDLGHSAALIERVKARLAAPQGLLVICGPANCGKTTTLYAMLDHLRATRPGLSILSIEDPVELHIPGVTQVKLEPQRGLTYPVVLRSALRQDPQVLTVGEVRDRDVADIVIEAGLTGHLLLTTMHAASPGGVIVRLREMGIPPYQITSTLMGVLSQRLIRTVADGPTHFSGLAAVGQFVELTSAMRQCILANADATTLETVDRGTGELREDAKRHLNAGRTTPEEIERVLGAASG